MARRHLVLPARGVLLVNTDVHGNAEDFARLEAVFREERAREPETHWVILGDVVHGPDAEARASEPELYGYPDGSMEIVDRIRVLREEAPDHVHFVLGNHDHGHVGGHHTKKFHEDEVEALEATLSEAERERLRAVFREALLAVAAPCGVLLTHGSPDDALTDLRVLDDVPLDVREMKYAQRMVIRSLLGSYGQPDAVSRKMLAQVSASTGLSLGVVIHGHDRDDRGFFVEGRHQLCPVIFGAPRANKRYVRLDLGARYASVEDVRDGHEIRRLHG
jgi:hypothetical protein